MTFGVFKSTETQGFQSPIIFDQNLASTQNSFDLQRYGFSSDSIGGLYMIDVGIGVASGQNAEVDLLVGGGVVKMVTLGSTNHNGVVTLSRSMLLYIPPYQFVSTQLNSGNLLGGYNEKYTSFSGFSLSKILSQDSNIYAMVAGFNLPSYPFSANNYVLPLQSLAAPLNYNIVTGNAYECKVTGPYVFSFSAKVAANRFLRLAVEGLEINFEVLSYSTNRNGAKTLTRTFVAQCNQGTTVRMSLKTGEIFDAESSSFTAFLYSPIAPQSSPQSTPQSDQIWGIYKSYGSNTQSGSALDPFLFDKTLVNPGNLYDGGLRSVRIQVSGYYYIYTSCGIERSRQVNMRVVRIKEGTNVVENIYYLRNSETTASKFILN